MNLVNKLKKNQSIILKKSFLALTLMVFVALTGTVQADIKSPPPEKIKTIMIGDQVVDIAYHLGVLPTAMVVRGGMWNLAKEFRNTTQILGCPHCISNDELILPKAVKKFGVKRIIIEKSFSYFLYMGGLKPEDIVSQLADLNVKIEYVDFSDGIESAIKQTAKLVDRESKASDVITQYKKSLAKNKKSISGVNSEKTAVIFNGMYQETNGKTMLRVEASGGYSDRFLLNPLGYTNIGDGFKNGDEEPSKGHYLVRKNRKGMVLESLLKADPDVIIMIGDAFAVQKSLADYGKTHPQLAQLKAIKNMAVYALPAYIDSSVLEYPTILKKWSVALIGK